MRNTLSEWFQGPLIRNTVIRDIKISYAPRDTKSSEKQPLSYSLAAFNDIVVAAAASFPNLWSSAIIMFKASRLIVSERTKELH